MEKYISPIVKSNWCINDNRIYIKREDLLPFSFGGNKARIVQEFFEDMRKQNKNCLIGYGNARSNLCRLLANKCSWLGYPCLIISPLDNDGQQIETNNSRIVKLCGAQVITCNKAEVAATVESTLEDCEDRGLKPYYIYGDKFGQGNEAVPVNAYRKVYDEIIEQEKRHKIEFDMIFHASGTGMTQAGLICGQILNGEKSDKKKIIGISTARTCEQEIPVLRKYIKAYLKNDQKYMPFINPLINLKDKWVLNGYGQYNIEILNVIKKTLQIDGLPLDTTYTGKAFYGMLEYIKQQDISGKKILFIHTGGTPIFFDNLIQLFLES